MTNLPPEKNQYYFNHWEKDVQCIEKEELDNLSVYDRIFFISLTKFSCHSQMKIEKKIPYQFFFPASGTYVKFHFRLGTIRGKTGDWRSVGCNVINTGMLVSRFLYFSVVFWVMKKKLCGRKY